MSAKNHNYAHITSLNNTDGSFSSIKRVENIIRKNLFSVLVVFSVAALLTVLLVCTLLPDASAVFPSEKSHNTVSFLTLEAGRAKCEAIHNRRNKAANFPSEDRYYNPRAESTQEPILLKNAVVWDGQGNVLENVDIYIENGIIRQVEKNIQIDLNKKVKVINVTGHIVSPGLVDMHRYIHFTLK
jgi:hypothetical protein